MTSLLKVLPSFIDRARENWSLYALPLVAVLVGAIVLDSFRSCFRLRHIPGPWWASFSKLWLIRATAGGRMHLDYAGVAEKYGPLSRVGPNDIVVNDAAEWRRILSVRSPYKRSDWYVGMRFDPAKENIESERDEVKYAALRSKMAAGYSGKEIEHLEESIDQNISAFVKLIEKYVPEKGEFKPLEFCRKAQYLTMDVISTVAFSKAFGYIAADSDFNNYLTTADDMFPAIMMVCVLPWLNWLLQTSVMRKVLPSDKDLVGFGNVMGIAKEVVATRFGPKKEARGDMLGSFIAHGLTKEEAESESILQIIAGSDTTATAIRSTFMYIITNPLILAKFRAEYTNASVSSPITDAEARRLPYLQACIKEGLRMWPPVVGLMAKTVPPGGDTICDTFVPGGTSVGYCAFGIWRDKKRWGEDANMFRPERWIEGEKKKIKELEQVFELAFAVGKWQCLGKNIALLELNKVFVELFRRFDFAVVDPTKVWKTEYYGICAQTEMWVTVSRRDQE